MVILRGVQDFRGQKFMTAVDLPAAAAPQSFADTKRMQLTSTTVLKASCLCRQASIIIQGPPLRSHYCHCTICQSLHSAPYALIAVYSSSNLILPDHNPPKFAIFSPKDGLNVYRCHECGVTVCARVENYKVWVIYVGAGISLDGKRIRPMEVPSFEG